MQGRTLQDVCGTLEEIGGTMKDISDKLRSHDRALFHILDQLRRADGTT